MVPTFNQILQSPQFKFLVSDGKEKKQVTVHATAIAATCDYMNKLINGAMAEAQDGCAEIEDMEFDDFVRFCEYAYRGDYTVPSWTEAPFDTSVAVEESEPTAPPEEYAEAYPSPMEEPEPAPEPEPEPAPDDGWGFGVAQKVKKGKSKKTIRTGFQKCTYSVSHPPLEAILAGFKPQTHTLPTQDFTPVFLAHAHLYKFAQMRLIEPLKVLSLQKLHHSLANFTPFENRIGDVVELARYAYTDQDIPNRTKGGKIDKLRNLILEYIVQEVKTVGKSKEFFELLEEGGEFASDIWRKVHSTV